jgi:hypothetical protein
MRTASDARPRGQHGDPRALLVPTLIEDFADHVQDQSAAPLEVDIPTRSRGPPKRPRLRDLAYAWTSIVRRRRLAAEVSRGGREGLRPRGNATSGAPARGALTCTVGSSRREDAEERSGRGVTDRARIVVSEVTDKSRIAPVCRSSRHIGAPPPPEGAYPPPAPRTTGTPQHRATASPGVGDEAEPASATAGRAPAGPSCLGQRAEVLLSACRRACV